MIENELNLHQIAQMVDLSAVQAENDENYIRKLIAKAMHQSLQNSAQLTHHLGADARTMLNLRKVAKKAYDNGLDANGVENALGVLKKMGRERKKNIYLISHKDELIGRVNNVLRVIKENGFTSYANDLEIEE
jgi:uncharacterized protein YabN with tetrapyrrole methylase and pyrophosphatase domain